MVVVEVVDSDGVLVNGGCCGDGQLWSPDKWWLLWLWTVIEYWLMVVVVVMDCYPILVNCGGCGCGQ